MRTQKRYLFSMSFVGEDEREKNYPLLNALHVAKSPKEALQHVVGYNFDNGHLEDFDMDTGRALFVHDNGKTRYRVQIIAHAIPNSWEIQIGVK